MAGQLAPQKHVQASAISSDQGTTTVMETQSKSQVKLIMSLPIGLIEMMADHVNDNEDFYALRLSCRNLRNGSLDTFGKRFFRSKCFVYTIRGLQVLVEIARIPYLAKHLAFIRLCVPDIPEYGKLLLRLSTEFDEYHQDETDIKLLTAAFEHLKAAGVSLGLELMTEMYFIKEDMLISIGNAHSLYHKEMESEEDVELAENEMFRWPTLNDILLSSIIATRKSNIGLRNLEWHHPDYEWEDPLDRQIAIGTFKGIWQELSSHGHTLPEMKRLHLKIKDLEKLAGLKDDTAVTERLNELAEPLMGFLSTMPNLGSFLLDVSYPRCLRPFSDYVPNRILECCHWQSLGFFLLIESDIRTDALNTFLMNYRASLRIFKCLGSLQVGEKDEWLGVLQTLGSLEALEYLLLDHICSPPKPSGFANLVMFPDIKWYQRRALEESETRGNDAKALSVTNVTRLVEEDLTIDETEVRYCYSVSLDRKEMQDGEDMQQWLHFLQRYSICG